MKKQLVPDPFPSFQDWKLARLGRSSHYARIEVPRGEQCWRCDGYGRDHPDDAVRDPIEGYKMVDMVTCPRCGGSGRDHGLRSIYAAAKKKHEQHKTMIMIDNATIDSINSKLTKAEVEFIKRTCYR